MHKIINALCIEIFKKLFLMLYLIFKYIKDIKLKICHERVLNILTKTEYKSF